MLEAYQVYEDETSSSSGVPIYIARTGDPNIDIEIEEQLDIADQALAKYDEAQGEKDKPPKGISRFAVPVDVSKEGEDKSVDVGGLAREAFYRERAEEAQRRRAQGAQQSAAGGRKPRWDPSEYG